MKHIKILEKSAVENRNCLLNIHAKRNENITFITF